MLDTFSNPDENPFLDALEEIDASSDSGLDYPNDGQFDVWISNPESVEARRSKFFYWLGLDVDKISSDDSEESSDLERVVGRIKRASFEYDFSSSRSSISCFSSDDSSSSGNLTPKVNFDSEIVGGESKESNSGISVVAKRPDRVSSSSSFSGEFSSSQGQTKRVKKWWLSRLQSFTCVTEKNEEESCNKHNSFIGDKIQRLKVNQHGKKSKEFSALYYHQTIQAHKGAILTMKFSPNGKFLASAGEDKVVRVWQVIEDDRLNERDIPDLDLSSIYFTLNQFLELKPHNTGKEKSQKTGRLRRSSDSSCVVLPPKVFRLMEKPLHEFEGHTSEILDLSWSRSNYLLSSSVDKTIRIWHVGNNHCLKVFPHNNYVTCVEFNPLDENYFISGSIDGKVRIWETTLCKVVSWTEVKDIVTAVCYRSDGLGGIIGSITGSCRFYSISDHQIQLDGQISLNNKKSSVKRVTGFQFFPHDPTKVMISCADSQVRIVQGAHIIGKYKGIRSTGSFSSAHFTSNSKHIVLASEDSSINIWKCANHGHRERPHIKKVNSFERFISNASIAVLWPGVQHESIGNRWQKGVFNSLTSHGKSFFSPANFSCGQNFFQESVFPKGSALWPEEKLLDSIKTSSMHKSEYKFLRTCLSKSDSHAWGMVIVTAGWDGRIKSFHNYGLPVAH